jgi:hypothetical protein
MMTFNVDLVVKKKNPASRRLSLTMDFTFNKLRQVKKLSLPMQNESTPWY